MKIINKLACPIDYDCWYCVNYKTSAFCKKSDENMLSSNIKFKDKNGAYAIQILYNKQFILCSDYSLREN